MQTFVVIVSVAATIFFIYSLAVFFKNIYENRLAGIITAIVGFAGSFVIFSGSDQNPQLIFLGVGLWIVGLITARLFVRKNSMSK